MFYLLDGGESGNETRLMQQFQGVDTGSAMSKTHKQLYVAYNEKDLAERLAKFKSTAQLQQMETIHVVSASKRASEKRHPRANPKFQGMSSAGNLLSPVSLLPYSSSWTLTLKQKKELYGPLRVPVGGATDGEIFDRADGDMEPASWHLSAPELYQELFQSETMADAVLDFTPFDVATWQAFKSQLPYIGVCFTEAHRDLLFERLSALAVHEMRQPGSFLYDPILAEALKCTSSVVPAPKIHPPKPVKRKTEAETETGLEDADPADTPPKKQQKVVVNNINDVDDAHAALRKRIDELKNASSSASRCSRLVSLAGSNRSSSDEPKYCLVSWRCLHLVCISSELRSKGRATSVPGELEMSTSQAS